MAETKASPLRSAVAIDDERIKTPVTEWWGKRGGDVERPPGCGGGSAACYYRSEA